MSIIKKNIDIFSDVLQKNTNKYISESTFPDDLKSGDLVLIFKNSKNL